MTRSYAPRRDRREVGYLKRHVRLPGGPKVVLDPEMKLQIADLEPNATPRTQWCRLGNFTQPKQISVKAASIAFAVRRDCELNMIDA